MKRVDVLNTTIKCENCGKKGVYEDKRTRQGSLFNKKRMEEQKSQADVAAETEIYQSRISSIENGATSPTEAELEKLLSYYDISLNEYEDVLDDITLRKIPYYYNH